MKPSATLQFDHEALRVKLVLLEACLSAPAVGCSTLRDVTASLATSLRTHTETEDGIFSRIAVLLPAALAESTEHLHDEHQNQRTWFAILHDRLRRDDDRVDPSIRSQAGHLLEERRTHMRTEEALFPMFDRAWGTASAVSDELPQLFRRACARKGPGEIAGSVCVWG